MNHIPDHHYDFIVGKMSDFFRSKGFMRVNYSYHRSILAACEQPDTITIFNFSGKDWPIAQTNQMWLEYKLLTDGEEDLKRGICGYFCETTSYRDEPNPVLGRHQKIFPMFEFEFHGNMENLQDISTELLSYLGFGDKSDFTYKSYEDTAKYYNVKELEHEHEAMMKDDFSHAFFLTDFPNYSSPFWNMAQHEDRERAKKIDVILYGQETIGSAERSSSK